MFLLIVLIAVLLVTPLITKLISKQYDWSLSGRIAFAIGLHIPSIIRLTAWLLIIFFILILPANIHAALNNINYQEATFSGPGTDYLWMRVPLQIIFIIWTWFFGIKLK